MLRLHPIRAYLPVTLCLPYSTASFTVTLLITVSNYFCSHLKLSRLLASRYSKSSDTKFSPQPCLDSSFQASNFRFSANSAYNDAVVSGDCDVWWHFGHGLFCWGLPLKSDPIFSYLTNSPTNEFPVTQ